MQNTYDDTDVYWMNEALRLATLAKESGEVPVGSVLVLDNKKIAEGWNQPIATCDPSAHAEINCLRAAGTVLGNYRLVNTTLYVTLEPCAMCVGALIHARVARVVFGAFDQKTGGIELLALRNFNHVFEYVGGVLETESQNLLQQFFKERREGT